MKEGYVIHLTEEEYKDLEQIFYSNLSSSDKNINLARVLGFKGFVELYEETY